MQPFNLSSSNHSKKLDETECPVQNSKFKARKIPKNHKVPFMVFHSTKNLTSFRNPSENREKNMNKRAKI